VSVRQPKDWMEQQEGLDRQEFSIVSNCFKLFQMSQKICYKNPKCST